MKRLCVATATAIGCLILLASCSAPCAADQTPVVVKSPSRWLTSFDAALAEAQKTGKPILANFTGSHTDPWGWPWCWKLNQEVFEENRFKKWAKENVVLLLLTYPTSEPQDEATKKANAAVAKKYGVEEYPTILLITPDGKSMGILGYQRGGVGPWIQSAQKILDEKKSTGN